MSIQSDAAEVLRKAIKWWEDHPQGFQQGAMYTGNSASDPTTLCSLGNVRFHGAGSALASDTPVTRVAIDAVLKAAKADEICALNNRSSREEMMAHFTAAATALDAEAAAATA